MLARRPRASRKRRRDAGDAAPAHHQRLRSFGRGRHRTRRWLHPLAASFRAFPRTARTHAACQPCTPARSLTHMIHTPTPGRCVAPFFLRWLRRARPDPPAIATAERSPDGSKPMETALGRSIASREDLHIDEKLSASCARCAIARAHARHASRARSTLRHSSVRELGAEIRCFGGVRVRVERVCEQMCARFGGQEPSLTLIPQTQVRTTKPQNLDLAAGSVGGT